MTTAQTYPDVSPERIQQITEEIKKELNTQNNLDVAKFKDTLRQEYEGKFIEEVKRFEEEERAKRKPLTHEELQKLLSKEYVKFTVDIQDSDEKTRRFVIKELPQSIEQDLYSGAREVVSELVQKYNHISFKVVDNDLFQNIMELMDIFIPVQRFLAQCCATILNPKKDKEDITVDWVQNNLTNYRIVTIIMAQVEVNKMRDFFSILFQGFQNGMTIG